MKKLLALISSILLVLVLVVSPVLALSVNNPDSLLIDQTDAYGSVLESGDQLYVTTFHLNYAAYPTTPVDQTFMLRIISANGTELGSSVLYGNPYFHTGYGYGAISVYFPASTVSALGMTWGASYYSELIGNPAITWSAGLPIATANITSWTTPGNSALGIRVLYLATQFQSAWGLTTTPLTTSGSLTDDGEAYFDSIIPVLRTACPTIYSSYVTTAQYHPRTFSLTYAITLRNQWVGTWLDLTNLGVDWGIDPIWLYGFLWCIAAGAIGYFLTMGARTTKYLTYELALMIIFGVWAGFLSYFAGAILGIVAVLALVNQLAWRRSSA